MLLKILTALEELKQKTLLNQKVQKEDLLMENFVFNSKVDN